MADTCTCPDCNSDHCPAVELWADKKEALLVAAATIDSLDMFYNVDRARVVVPDEWELKETSLVGWYKTADISKKLRELAE